ncbi:MAG: sn-glycerol-1-phosphate dehydrogenase [Lentisphaeria bacterium]|nr:sn-glycerol-1-phosphate dehydrogenase [Lentisphaeria bacterium]
MTMKLVPVPEGLQTAAFLLDRGALQGIPELLQTFFPGKAPWIVADSNTWNAAGEAVSRRLQDAGFSQLVPCIFPGTPQLHPEMEKAQFLAENMPENCVPLAVGSGVINDLVKCACGIRNVRYCCVATACSVDGYTASGSCMRVNGSKKTIPCPAPYAVCADVDVLEKAPAEMFAAGYADLLAKATGGVDWQIADALGMEPIRQDVWDLVQKDLRDRVADPGNMGPVFGGLAASGYAMQMYHDSRPASGCEHLFSHVWEMEELQLNGKEVSHGFKVGVGTLIATLLFEYVAEHSFEELLPRMTPPLTLEERKQEIADLTARGCYGTVAEENALKKYLTPAETLRRRETIRQQWQGIQQRIRKQMIPFEELRRMLKHAGCPVSPAEIGLEKAQYLHVVPTAQLIRVRYTVLDLLYECGLLADACKKLTVLL